MAKRYLIDTYGCQMNVHDSERMAGLLEQAGYEPAADASEADLVIINTCSVREHAEDKLYTRLGELRVLGDQTSRPPVVAVTGCVAQQEGTALLRGTNGHLIDVVVGTQQIKRLPMLVAEAEARADRSAIVTTAPWDDVTFPLGLTRRTDAVKAYVTIIEGCNDHCAFCVVPSTRGHERMRSRQEILAEVAEAVASGRPEIHLLGQIVNHYRAPDTPAYGFADLLADVDRTPGVERIRFASPHPRHTDAALIEAIQTLPRVCKHLHLPVQSGSSRILHLMRRRHDRQTYLDLAARLREEIPDIALSTDVIVGFPGETEADFEDTLSLTEQVRFQSMFSFKYSPRPGTLASRRMPDDVSEADKTRRIVALQALQRRIQTELHERAVGATIPVLIDSASRKRDGDISGRTMGNMVVSLEAPSGSNPEHWIGRTLPVIIERAGPHSLRGRALHPGHPHADTLQHEDGS